MNHIGHTYNERELRTLDKNKLQLYFIAGTNDVGEKSLLDVLEAALKGGITAFQLCEKGERALRGDDLRLLAEQCLKLCKKYHVPFIVNDHVELALEIGADGVHIGQEPDMISVVRREIGPDKALGVSTCTLTDALTASDAGANYISAGPLYASKLNRIQPAGLALVQEIVQELPGLPLVGVGGVSERKAELVVQGGASGVAVTAAIASAEDVEATTRAIKGHITLALTGVEM